MEFPQAQAIDERLRNKPPRIPRFVESDNNINPITNEIELMKLPLLFSSQIQPTAFFLPPPETRSATINLDKAIEFELKHGRKLDPQMDRKKLRRTVSNRISAQKSRLRKAQYIHDMERKVNELEETLTFLEEKSARWLEKRRLLKVQNETLHHLLAIRENQANQAQMVFEKNKAEVNRLREVEKALLRMSLNDGGMSSSSCSGFFEDDEQVGSGMAGQVPFLNFDA
ncbi:hypothetical protein C2S53_018210 [Perilla frutescens var. hirtella]|uniref:BZIP domain-containing protein n=1 Tax=Perilla frutescens var. hirtella TaxID=608512 RepID=A0AAD4J2W4_PERFH|nr:hypothetical protein C2S53_018210 [Perilla frutescens var. hirtella]